MVHDEDDNFDDNDGPSLSDREAPDPSDVDDGDDETAPCPYCRKPVYNEAEICPHCRNFISFEDAPRRRPWWIWIGVILGFIGMLWWVF